MITKNTPVRFGIIGFGAVAGHHVRSIQESELCELAAVYTSRPEKAAGLGVPVYTDYTQMMDKEEIHVVNICTPSGMHLEPVLAAASRGIHILTEKPMDANMDRAGQMVEACHKAGVKLGCIFQNRFKPDFLFLQKAVQEQRLGKLIAGNAYIKWYRSPEYYQASAWRGTIEGDGGAALINQGIHTIDLLQLLMGEPVSVFGKIATLVHSIEGEDIGLGLVQFQNGALGTIEASTAMIPGYPERLEIYGEKGSAILESGKIIAWNVPGPAPEMPDLASSTSGASDPMAISHLFHKIQIEDMAGAVLEDRPPVVTGQEGLKSLRLIMGIYESSRLGREVVF